MNPAKSTVDTTAAGWRKSSRSNSQGSCVEIAGSGGHTLIRDSKDPAGGVLRFDRWGWQVFLGWVKAGGPVRRVRGITDQRGGEARR